IGFACSCGAGAASGTRMCNASGAAECAYPSEICNGADDDCNGAPDDTFTCAAGASRSCNVVIGGCTATGTQSCSASCAWGTCVTAEVCNRTDDDCNGLVDERLL